MPKRERPTVGLVRELRKDVAFLRVEEQAARLRGARLEILIRDLHSEIATLRMALATERGPRA